MGVLEKTSKAGPISTGGASVSAFGVAKPANEGCLLSDGVTPAPKTKEPKGVFVGDNWLNGRWKDSGSHWYSKSGSIEFHVGQGYERKPATSLKCRKCGSV